MPDFFSVHHWGGGTCPSISDTMSTWPARKDTPVVMLIWSCPPPLRATPLASQAAQMLKNLSSAFHQMTVVNRRASDPWGGEFSQTRSCPRVSMSS